MPAWLATVATGHPLGMVATAQQGLDLFEPWQCARCSDGFWSEAAAKAHEHHHERMESRQ